MVKHTQMVKAEVFQNYVLSSAKLYFAMSLEYSFDIITPALEF